MTSGAPIPVLQNVIFIIKHRFDYFALGATRAGISTSFARLVVSRDCFYRLAVPYRRRIYIINEGRGEKSQDFIFGYWRWAGKVGYCYPDEFLILGWVTLWMWKIFAAG